ncbi:monocarboxylate transporter 12-B-like [Patiria miniata]|uniref:Major facilitator superfamily (MFS) profile domain-containing protein n=1 Tax=Patiria miniata TaxID=46514 RepID=A0A914BPA2_PATMI|nr:monocarboxylate transporter 12-B-like [Patiria miniata]
MILCLVLISRNLRFSFLFLFCWYIGLAMSLIQVSIVKPLVDYFPDDFAAANGVTFAGGTVGIIVIPPVVEHLVSIYGWRSALLLMGAFSFNYVLCGALLRPLRRPLAAHYKQIRGDDDTGCDTHPTGRTDGIDPERSVNICGKCWHIVSGVSNDVFTTSKFLIFQAVILLCGMVFSSWHLFVIPQGVELGFGDGPAAYLAIFAGVGSLVGRLSHGTLVDRGLIRAPSLFVLSSLVFAASCLVNPWAESSYAALAVISTVGGVAIGVFFPLTFVILREIVSDRYISAIGWLYLFLSIGHIIGGTLSGWIHDVSGSYGSVFVSIGAFAILMAACVLFIDGMDNCYGRDDSIRNTAARESDSSQ